MHCTLTEGEFITNDLYEETKGGYQQNLLQEKPCFPKKSFSDGFCGLPEQIFADMKILKGTGSQNEDPYFKSYSSLHIHELMIKDGPRTQAYKRAIELNSHLFKDKIVLDVGAGTGILSIFAAKVGAKHVYAVERSDTADIAVEIIQENNLTSKITVIKKEVENVRSNEIPKVDIIISEWMGFCLLYESMLDSVLKARDMFLKEGGVMFPSRAKMYIAAIDDAYYKETKANFWKSNEYGIKMTCISDYMERFLWVDQIQSDQIISDCCKIFDVDTHSCSIEDLEFANEYSLTILKGGHKLSGFVIWFEVDFESEEQETVTISTSPFAPFTHWKHQILYLQNRENHNIIPDTNQEVSGSFALRKCPQNPRDIQIKLSLNLDENSEPKVQQASFQMTKAFQEIDNKNSDIGNCMEDFKINQELGRGSYGTVYKVSSFKNNMIYVLKKISLKHMKPKQQQAALKEVQILRNLDHPHIIKYYTSFIEDEAIHIVMEFAEKGDLYKLLKEQRQKRKYFSEKDIWDFSYQICLAVEYIHSKNIIHRDIKCLNIFLTEDKKIKIGDLGVSKIVSSAAAQQDTRVGTPLYLSPELVKQQPYDFKVDVWAIGCAIYHLACLEPPFQGDNLITLGNSIVNKKPKPLPQIYSNKLSNFIDKFLIKKASDRPTAREAVIMIPQFVKSAYQDIINKKSLLKFEDQQAQQYNSINTAQSNDNRSKEKSNSPSKEVKSPTRKQIQEKIQENPKKLVEPTGVKIENNVPLINFYGSQQLQGRDKIIRKNKDVLTEKGDKTPQRDKSPSKKSTEKSGIFNQEKKQELQTGGDEVSNQVPQNNNFYSKSQSQDKFASPKVSSPLQGLKNPYQEGFGSMAQNFQSVNQRIQPLVKAESSKDVRNSNMQQRPLLSTKLSSNIYQQSQVAQQSTSDETKITNKQQQVQNKIENALNKLDEENNKRMFYQDIQQQQSQGQVIQQKEESRQFQLKQLSDQFGREMPFNARPQTASASHMHQRRSLQQQSVQSQASNQKPGISLLRNLVSKNTQEDAIQEMQNQHVNYRPFSAVVPPPKPMSRKKIVAFEDEFKEENSDLDIPNDDDSQIADQVRVGKEQHRVDQNKDIIIRRGFNMRPSTAGLRSQSQHPNILNTQIKQSYESINKNQPIVKSNTQPIAEQRKIVAQSIDFREERHTQRYNNNKNELNIQNRQDFENQFSKFFKVNLQRQSVMTQMNASQSQVINDHNLKEKIRNFQPIGVLSSGPLSNHDHNNIKSQHPPTVNGLTNVNSSQSLVEHKSPRQAEVKNQRINMPPKNAQMGKQRKITIRDLQPITQQTQQDSCQ